MLPGETEYSPYLNDSQFGDYVIDPDVKAIAKGVCNGFDQRKLAIGSLYLQKEGTFFVATNEDPVYIAGGSGRLCPDVGATLAALETACNRKAHCVGKPGSFALGVMLADHFGGERDRWSDPDYLKQFCYVGDNLWTDVGFGNNSGIGSVLVLTGISKLEQHSEEI